jgi:hypothetical protein
VLLFTQDGDQKMSLPATSIDVAGGRDPMEKLLSTVNPLLSSAGIVKVFFATGYLRLLEGVGVSAG